LRRFCGAAGYGWDYPDSEYRDVPLCVPEVLCLRLLLMVLTSADFALNPAGGAQSHILMQMCVCVCACIVPIIASGTSNIGFLIRCDCVVRGHLNTACHCFEVAGLEPDFWVRTPLPKLYW